MLQVCDFCEATIGQITFDTAPGITGKVAANVRRMMRAATLLESVIPDHLSMACCQ